MKTKIEKASLKNLKDIQKLNLKLFEREYRNYDKSLNLEWTFGKKGKTYFKNKISKSDSLVLVARINNRVVGYLVGSILKPVNYRKISKMAELENMFVLKKYRNLGIGTKLVNSFIDWCKSKNVEIVRVEAFAQNESAINFYKRNKFKKYTLILESEL